MNIASLNRFATSVSSLERRARTLLLVAASVLALSACSGSQDTEQPLTGSKSAPAIVQKDAVVYPPDTGFWWNPAEPGVGYAFEQQGDKGFFAAFIFAPEGYPIWYVASGSVAGNTFTGELVRYSGGQGLNAAQYRPPVERERAGRVTLVFGSGDDAQLSWPGKSVGITRYAFGPGGNRQDNAFGAPERGWWWAPSEGGRGYALEQQGDSLFVAMFGYPDTSPNSLPVSGDLWYSGQARMELGSARDFATRVPLNAYTGGTAFTGPYKPIRGTNAGIGALGFKFSDACNGTLTFPDGRQIAITKFLFGASRCASAPAPEHIWAVTPSANPQHDGLRALNRIRAAAGALPLGSDRSVSIAASGHADYLASNAAIGSIQMENRTGFTGITPSARLETAGWPSRIGLGETVGYASDWAAENMAALLDQSNDRSLLLMGWAYAGVGEAACTYCSGNLQTNPARRLAVATFAGTNFGNTSGAPVIVWPPSDALQVPTGRGAVISMQSTTAQFPLRVGTWTLRDVASGALMPSTVDDRDANGTLYGDRAFLRPAVLDRGREYEVAFSGTHNTLPYAKSWRFTTMPGEQLRVNVTPVAVTMIGSQAVTVTITGGAARMRLVALDYAPGATEPHNDGRLPYLNITRRNANTYSVRSSRNCPQLGSCSVVLRAVALDGSNEIAQTARFVVE